jgi:DNA polymerase III delta subunit
LELAKKSVNVFLLSGNDASLIHGEADKLVRSIAGDNPDPFAFELFQEGDAGPTAAMLYGMVRSLKSPPFLGGQKTVWLKHFTGFDAEGEKKSGDTVGAALRDLAELISTGIGQDIVLVMDGVGIDRRRALAKACEAVGELRVYNQPDRKKTGWERTMVAYIQQAAADKGLTLREDVGNFLVDIVGTDTSRVDAELEKLICYCGGVDRPVTMADAEAVCTGQAEEMIWVMGSALGSRNLASVLQVVDSLVGQEKDDDRAARSLIINAAHYFRESLRIKVFMAEQRLTHASALKRFLEGASSEEKNALVAEGMTFATYHPYRAMKLAEEIGRFTPQEMIEAIRVLRDALWQCMSSATAARVSLENALIRIVGCSRR